MPNILALKEIDGELWARIGRVGSFPDSVSLWTPEEQKENYLSGIRDALETLNEFYKEKASA